MAVRGMADDVDNSSEISLLDESRVDFANPCEGCFQENERPCYAELEQRSMFEIII